VNSLWKIIGIVFSIVGAFFGSAISMGYAWGGCGSDIECVIVPKVAGLLVLLSLVSLFICIYAFVQDFSKIKQFMIGYIVIACALSLSIFLFKEGGIAYNAIHNTTIECSLFSDYKNGICISNLARQKNDIGICNTITDSLWKNNCTSYFAKEENNPNLCGTEDISCLYILAKNTKDQKICEQIPNQGLARSNCYTLVAKETGDKSICKTPDVGKSKCNLDSLIYPASKVTFSVTENQSAVLAGSMGVKLGVVNIVATGGDGALGGLSIVNTSDLKVSNIKMIVGGETLLPVRSTNLDNEYIQNAIQYDFDFGNDYLLLRENTPSFIVVIADIPQNASGKTLYIRTGGSSYPSGLNFEIEGVGATVISTIVK